MMDKGRWVHKNGRIFYRDGHSGYYGLAVMCKQQWGASSQGARCACRKPYPRGWRNSWVKGGK